MDDARLERLTKVVGGRFRLTALVQKRMQEITTSAHAFGEPNIDNMFERVLSEIESGRIKIELPEGGEPRVLPETGKG